MLPRYSVIILTPNMPQVGISSTCISVRESANSVIPGLWEKMATLSISVVQSANSLFKISCVGMVQFRNEKDLILSFAKFFAKISAVFFALFAGLETKRSILIFLSKSRLAISGASFLPRSFNGRSKSDSRAVPTAFGVTYE